MRLYSTILVLALFFSFALNAQQNVEAGIFAGIANYQGDLAEDQVEIGETKIAYGAFLSYMVSPKVIIRGNAFYGTITGDDANSPSNQIRGISFEGNILEVGLTGQWLIFGKNRYNNSGIFVPQFTPYLSTGVGLSVINSTVSFKTQENEDAFQPELLDTDNFLIIPFSFGLRFDATEHLTIGAELGARSTFSDYVDNVSINGNPNKNDWYIFGGMSIAYVFGGADNFKF